ncbi:hypothetical protein OSB04_015174 [Centaurea solstitialis]|uniref:Phosphatidylinositol N-acetylglucosaminyltransferase subunit H conserved domain-containing protein n=1 Tax=Centaurea solstitialis TaxID=347529 RepID=A0AA38SYH5_9ASTR|nr:hypothetical protein OSB04_015174 [Centaurea solstitialis]
MAEPLTISNARFTYVHDDGKFLPSNAVDTHHIVARRGVVKPIAIYLFVMLLVAYAIFLHLEKGKPVTTVIWSVFVGALLIKLLIWSSIVKGEDLRQVLILIGAESVVIMPAFGVQLETHYGSGRINRCFIPVSKILKPVLNECVTPVTCCWCLSLLVHEKDELTLVFKEFRPPLKMLVPIWKALCAATDHQEISDLFREDGRRRDC